MVGELLNTLGVQAHAYQGGDHAVHSPIDGRLIASISLESADVVPAKVDAAHQAYLSWRNVPAPRRGELVRLFGEVLREYKTQLGELVSIEAGKITRKAWAKCRR